MTTVVASDIDGTLCVSTRRADSADLVVVDTWDGGAAVTTPAGHAAWTRLCVLDAIVPVTTRSISQLTRMDWPGPFPRFAITSNGAEVLVDGRPEPGWAEEVRRYGERIPWGGAQADAVLGELVSDGRRLDAGPALIAGVSCVRPPSEALVVELQHAAAEQNLLLSVQGRKVYLAPPDFGKGEALDWLCATRDLEVVAAAGDSTLDLGFLRRMRQVACPDGSQAAEQIGSDASYLATGSPPERVGRIAEWLLANFVAQRDTEQRHR